MTGLYLHVPICIARCRYCDFYKLTPGEWNDIARYVECLELELRRLPPDFAPESVFIGGGTPTALDIEPLTALLEAVHRTIDLSRVVEFSSEANPGTLTPEKLAVMREGGINRVSLGIQSFNNRALRLLGRIHDADQAVDGFRMLRSAGFGNVNIDLIQSIPGMSREELLADARKAALLEPEHVSYYNLIYEPGTPMTLDRDAGRIRAPGDDEEADNYYAVKALLEKSGFDHYEISNFCRPGHECLQNLLYWQGGEYLGCGPSAHSHWQGARYGNISDLGGYCDRLQQDQRPFDEVERLAAADKARETLVMWLRLTGGIDLAAFERQVGTAIDELCGPAIQDLLKEGLLERSKNRLALSPDALFVSNSVLSELV